MQPKTITRELADKVVKMCKGVFPEYKSVEFRTRFGTNEIWLMKADGRHDIFHWFELCVTHLSDSMFKEINKFGSSDKEMENLNLGTSYQSGGELLYNAEYEGKHVVDVLYNEYKKLMEWKKLTTEESKVL